MAGRRFSATRTSVNLGPCGRRFEKNWKLLDETDGKSAPVSLLYPLNVNNWMVAALNTAAELGAPRIDRDVVRAA